MVAFRRNIAAALLLNLALPVPFAFARFHHLDAEQIDQDFELNTETYNDILSYRHILSWTEMWDDARSGFRVTAGSLTVTRFYFAEDIKIDPVATNDLSIAFQQHRTEDSSEVQEAREVRLGIKMLDNLRLLVLGDGSINKEFGDVGIGARLFESENQYFDFIYWSVDHYYNDKTHEEGANYLQTARTYQFRGWKKLFSNKFSGTYQIEADLPFSWQRPLVGIYTYQRNKISGTLNWESGGDGYYFMTLDNDEKTESWSNQEWLNQIGFKRQSTFVEMGSTFKSSSSDNRYRLSAFVVNRLSKWHFANDPMSYRRWTAEMPPTSSVRKEYGFDLRSEETLSARTLFSQGIVANDVTIQEDAAHWQNLEVKYITAVNWNFTHDAGFGLNATWDIDQVSRDFPYKKLPFRPWGGGNIQAQMVF